MAMPREQKVAVKNLFEMHLFEAVIRQVTKRLNCAGQFLQDTESISLHHCKSQSLPASSLSMAPFQCAATYAHGIQIL